MAVNALISMVVLVYLVCPISSLDLTRSVFGNKTNFLPAAFGDFNSDKLTDLFVISMGGQQFEVLLSGSEAPLMNSLGPSCLYSTLQIKNLVPGDFDGNGAMDVLVISFNKDRNVYETFVAWGDLKTFVCGDETKPLISMKGQPLVMDANGDMIPDLFGENLAGKRSFWIFSDNQSQPPKEELVNATFGMSQLLLPSSHAFLDLTGDMTADMWVTTVDGFEMWQFIDGKFILNTTVHKPPTMKFVGQTSFADVDLDGNMEVIVPACDDELCSHSYVFAYDFAHRSWLDLAVNFQDTNKTHWWKFQIKHSSPYMDTVTCRVGDYNLDGYADILVTLYDPVDNQYRVTLLENTDNGNFTRKLVPKWGTFDAFGNSFMGTFVDFQEDGTLDVLLYLASGQVAVYKNPTEYDAVFLKVLVATGRCYKNCPTHVVPYGTNQPGPTVTYSITTATGLMQVSKSTQLSQSAHFALQLPYTFFGLGRNWNFIEFLHVGIFSSANSTGHGQSSRSESFGSFTQIIPNSQVIIIPFPPDRPDLWVNKLFITPSNAMLLTGGSLVATCFFVLAIIGLLHRKEKIQDKKEKQQEAHKFHFDAM